MPISIPGPLIEFILLGPLDDRRQLQDSPILGDVWVAFGARPHEKQDLLIAPYRGRHAGDVAGKIDTGLQDVAESAEDPNIAFLQGLIVASLTFEEMMQVVTPKTKWWISRRRKDDDPQMRAAASQAASAPKTTAETVDALMEQPGELKRLLEQVLTSAQEWFGKTGRQGVQEWPALKRFLTLTALLLWAAQHDPADSSPVDKMDYVLTQALEQQNLDRMIELLNSLAEKMLREPEESWLVWQVSLNRRAMPAISKSIPAVKADAATYLFKVNCGEIGWAVIDSGIDGRHPAFQDRNGNTRVKRSFDFKNFRRIVSLSNSRPNIRDANIAELIKDNDALKHPLKTGDPQKDEEKLNEVREDLERLAKDARKRGPIHWELVEKYVEIRPETPPRTNHGTHVAGIIGASREAARKVAEQTARREAQEREERRRAAEAEQRAAAGDGVAEAVQTAVEQGVEQVVKEVACKENPDIADGMCPDILLYDFRVLGPDVKDAEFAIIAALQFIRYLNDQDLFYTIHGANLSLSIPHDVRNFACGRTPICDECEQLVSTGVVVVAAAGNHGYKSYETKEGSYDSYAAFSITDPGNADNVLTVGSTHRFWPHTYGVSFFSSRGPTGDGRMKPDLVAPGERIRAPMPGNYEEGGYWGDLDGTSMAAPHVSGAAAMLMARYSELIGQPLRIKRILCESATDLGRERSFQGHGMLDVLRAFQSI